MVVRFALGELLLGVGGDTARIKGLHTIPGVIRVPSEEGYVQTFDQTLSPCQSVSQFKGCSM